jgi:UDPglucose 6-dehydrogenase
VIENFREGTLKFSTNLAQAAQESNLFFIAVGTPPGDDGSADLQSVLQVAKQLGQHIREYSVIVDKSTVPVGTADRVRTVIEKELEKRGLDIEFDVVSNPEFLKEGAAINDFLKPDRIVVGANSKRAEKIMKRLYAPFSRNRDKMLLMNVRDAEMTKYAANAMLATKISFMNEISNICERLGVDVENVRKGIGSDNRIGYSFIYPGCGYGGSCFPKDVKALIKTCKDEGFEPEVLNSVEKRNNLQKKVLTSKVIKKFGNDLSGKTFCVWGLSFKPGTDDIRDASSLVLITDLINAGGTINAYDPVAMEEAEKKLPEKWFVDKKLTFLTDQYHAIKNVDALILVTEWKTFRQPDFTLMTKLMRQKIIFDGRNQYDPEEVTEAGFEYHGIGREKNNTPDI